MKVRYAILIVIALTIIGNVWLRWGKIDDSYIEGKWQTENAFYTFFPDNKAVKVTFENGGSTEEGTWSLEEKLLFVRFPSNKLPSEAYEIYMHGRGAFWGHNKSGSDKKSNSDTQFDRVYHFR